MTMNIISPSQKISALYIAYFNRAPDAEGLSYWLTQASGVSAENLLRQISAGFSAHPQFQASYGALNNTQFVNALYQNMLGSAGDVSGVNYWVAKLEGGSTRADVVADFITGAMLTDLNAYRANTPGFTLADYDAALAKQNKLINKATVAVAFAEQLGAATNMGANPPADLTQSSAYQASQRILLGITDDSATANSKLTAISGLKSNANPVAAILTGASVFHSQGQFGFDNWIDTIYSTHQTELYTGSKNLGIAYGAIIENVTGGPSSDTVYDNKVDNVIKTGGGDDTIHLGAGGYDIIEAGAGSDTVFLPIASSQASFQTLFNGLIRLTGTTFSADLYGVEKITFTDQSILLV